MTAENDQIVVDSEGAQPDAAKSDDEDQPPQKSSKSRSGLKLWLS